MTLHRPDSSTAALGACLAAPLAAILAMASLARFQADPVAAAETGYLAFVAGVALLAAAAAARRPAVEGVVGPLLVVTATWTLPEGPTRGAVVAALAAATLVVAAWRWLPAGSGRPAAAEPATGAADREPVEPALPGVTVAALALGIQVLLRGGELVALGAAGPGGGVAWLPAIRAAVLLVGFPAVGAAAVLALARLHGRRRALLAAAAVLVAGPGFRPATLAALLALAATSSLLSRDPRAAWGPGGGLDRRHLLQSGRRLVPPGLALTILAAPFAWDPRAAAVSLAAGLAGGVALAVSRKRSTGGWAWAGPAVAGAACAGALLLAGRPAGEVVGLAALVPLAVPALALAERERVPVALAALLLAFAAARGVLVEGALAAPAGLAALAVPRRGPLAAVQGTWSGALLAAACLAAAYPWLRPWPLPDALRLVGIVPGWPGALLVVAGVAALAGLAVLVSRAGWADRASPAFRRWAGGPETAGARLAAGALAALVLLHLPAAGAALFGARPLVLDRERPIWSATIPAGDGGAPVRAIVVDSALANSAELPAGTPIATLRLQSPGRTDRIWTLRVGTDTGEWAADRPDLQALQPPAPEPWTSWVAVDGGAYFGHRYRARRRFPEPFPAEGIELSLRPDLPPAVGLSVYHLELRP
ncbi:MAG TPA: hypothetical protein VMR44_08370 [Thermoanaerobaculia bacterium]|nr:hypothetical protein [Thermoanaerobaculia bacterium]